MVNTKKDGLRSAGAFAIPRRGGEGSSPLSFAQQRLWFLDQLEPGNPAYNIWAAFRLQGTLDVAALERSIQELVRRHEALRTTFADLEGQPRQVIHAASRVPLPVVELQRFSGPEREEAAAKLATAEAGEPFDLYRGPLFRAKLLRLAPEDHVLLLTMHHSVSDAWSKEILLRELAALYGAFSQVKPSPLPELPIQYADYAIWQRGWLQGKVLESQLSYWKRQLGGDLPVLRLPRDRPRPAVQTFRGGERQGLLSRDLADALEGLGRREGVTLFMTLLATFQVLLSRHTGQEDIPVGTPIAGRTRVETEGLIGFFVNTLVLRGDLSGDPTFRELLKRVREVALEAYDHQDLPFEKLVDELEPERSLSHTPLFQVLFTLQNAPRKTLDLPGLTSTPMTREHSSAMFDLSLLMARTEQGLLTRFQYNSDLFDASTIDRMLERFEVLLRGIVADPGHKISRLPLLPEEERRKVLLEWNETAVAYPRDETVHGLFQAQVERSPEAVAVEFEDQSLTYAELNRRSNQLAHHLKRLGVGPEVLVGLCMERSSEMVVGLLGILKADGAYVALDPTYPKERLAFMLENTGALVLLTQEKLLEKIPATSIRILCIDRDWNEIAQQDTAETEAAASADNLAYVTYTSGSTGRPKGVMIPHRGIVRLLVGTRYASLSEESVLLHLAPISFDASTFEIWGALLHGGRCVIFPESVPEPSKLAGLIPSKKITTAWLTGSLFNMIIDSEPRALTGLRQLLIGGEVLSIAHVRRALELLPGTEIINGYGPTEGTTFTTCHSIRREDLAHASIPIGRPIANTQVYVLDAKGSLLPRGASGDLYIGGDGLARGYLNEPELTADRFIPDRFSNEPGARLYRSGDIARYSNDGCLEFLGRKDNQVKVRGFRIELGEIEAVLGRHPEVRESVVLAREGAPGQKRLVAYVVPVGATAPSIAELRSLLKTRLPGFMEPSDFVILDRLPLTASGKVDRGALPALDARQSRVEQAYEAPSTPAEKVLSDVWAEVLRVSQVGIRDNFFELGGDSILGIQIVSKARKVGLLLTPKQIFEHQTVAELAAVAGGAPLPAEQGVVQGPVPLTPIQRWLFSRALPDLHRWNMTTLLELGRKVNPALLEQVISRLVEHHDALRLRFFRDESGWEQVNAGREEARVFSRVDLSGLGEADRQAAFRTAAEELQDSLNLSEGPLLRAAFFDRGAHEPEHLLLVVHHLAVDGVSWRILLEDLKTAYEQLERGDRIELPSKGTSFQQWSHLLTEHVRSGALEGELPFWLAQTRRPLCRLPVDFPAGIEANTWASARLISVSLPAEETHGLLQEVPAAFHTQINDVLLTALVQAFSLWTGEHALLINLEGHGREEILEHTDLSRTVGWFTTLFPVLLQLDEADAPAAALQSIKEQLRRVPNRGIGYGCLRYLSPNDDTVRRLSALPRAEVSFNYFGQIDQPETESSLFRATQRSAGPRSRSPRQPRAHLIDVNCKVSDGRLQVNWTYSERVHRAETVEALANNFLRKLQALISNCRSQGAGGYTPCDFPDVTLSQEQLEKVLAELSGPPAPKH